MKPATSIEKVCRLLEAFRSKPLMGITEIAAQTGLLPSDVHRIVTSLEHFGYVAQDAVGKKYRLGLQLLKLGHLVHERIELRAVARPYLRQLSETARGTANLAVFDEGAREIIFVEQVEASEDVRIRLRIGARAMAHCTSVGKVLAAHLDAADARRLLQEQGLPKRTNKTITDLEKLEAELARVRSQGYGVDREESVPGAFCIGAPVRNHKGEVVAAVSLSTLKAYVGRVNEAKLSARVQKTAASISAALGYEEESCKTAIVRRKKQEH